LLIYTDGVTDARNGEAAPFTEQRLLELLSPAGESAAAMIARIQAAVFEHTAGATQFDDITVLAVHRSRGSGS
jgi:sigma-B regulation protein RsbU (phosphoserine phosphatase)